MELQQQENSPDVPVQGGPQRHERKKEVILWSDVLYSKREAKFQRMPIKVGTNTRIHQFESLNLLGRRQEQDLPFLVLDLPMENVGTYLDSKLDLVQGLSHDDNLIHQLERILQQIRNDMPSEQQRIHAIGCPPIDAIKVLDQSPLIESIPQARRELVLSKMKALDVGPSHFRRGIEHFLDMAKRPIDPTRLSKQTDNSLIIKDNQHDFKYMLPKRKLKALAKQEKILRSYFVNGKKAKEISKDLDLPKNFVQSSIDQFKAKAKRGFYNSKDWGSQSKNAPTKEKADDPVLLDLIAQYLRQHGIFKLTLSKLRTYIQEAMGPQLRGPCERTLSLILQKRFLSNYRGMPGSMTKYRDPLFNEKRVWISRILAQLLVDDVVIVCIDESNIRSDCLNERKWQFNPNALYKQPKKRKALQLVKSMARQLNPITAEKEILTYAHKLWGGQTLHDQRDQMHLLPLHTGSLIKNGHNKRLKTLDLRCKPPLLKQQQEITSRQKLVVKAHPPRRRGRPKKAPEEIQQQRSKAQPPRPRGRPKKVKTAPDIEEEQKMPATPFAFETKRGITPLLWNMKQLQIKSISQAKDGDIHSLQSKFRNPEVEDAATNLISLFNNIHDEEDSGESSKEKYEPDFLKESTIDKARMLYEERLGPYGQLSLELTQTRGDPQQKVQIFSLSLIAALSFEKVVGCQIIEGNINGVLFENFLYQTIQNLKSDPHYQSKQIIVFMDNARIHKHPIVIETLEKLQIPVLFNSAYSPWLNPVEQLFARVKQKLRKRGIARREDLFAEIKQLLKAMTPQEVSGLWVPPIKAWMETILLGHRM